MRVHWGQHATAIATIAGLLLGNAPPAAAADPVTWSFEDGVLHAEGFPTNVSCFDGNVRFAGSPDTTAPCADVELLEYVLTLSSVMSLEGVQPPDFDDDLVVDITGAAGADLIRTSSAGSTFTLTGDLGAGADDLQLGPGDVDIELGPGEDSVIATIDGPTESFQWYDCGANGGDVMTWTVGIQSLYSYPHPTGRGQYDVDGGAAAISSGCSHSVTQLNAAGGYADLVPGRTGVFSYAGTGSLPDAIYVDIRGVPFQYHDAIDAGTVLVDGFAPVFLTTFGFPLADRVYVYNGRSYPLIDAIYDLFLGRRPDSVGFWGWDDALWNGLPREQFVSALQRSIEHSRLAVDLAYRHILRRPADPTGRVGWGAVVQAGTTLDGLRSQLYGSGEYFTLAGQTNEGFIRRAYNDILGRNVDPTGLAGWTAYLNTHSRAQVAAALLSDPEPVGVAIRRTYQRLLGRNPTSAEINAWRPIWISHGEFFVNASIAGSGEFYQRVAPLDPAQEPAFTPSWNQVAPSTTDDTPTPPRPPHRDHRPTHPVDG